MVLETAETLLALSGKKQDQNNSTAVVIPEQPKSKGRVLSTYFYLLLLFFCLMLTVHFLEDFSRTAPVAPEMDAVNGAIAPGNPVDSFPGFFNLTMQE